MSRRSQIRPGESSACATAGSSRIAAAPVLPTGLGRGPSAPPERLRGEPAGYTEHRSPRDPGQPAAERTHVPGPDHRRQLGHRADCHRPGDPEGRDRPDPGSWHRPDLHRVQRRGDHVAGGRHRRAGVVDAGSGRRQHHHVQRFPGRYGGGRPDGRGRAEHCRRQQRGRRDRDDLQRVRGGAGPGAAIGSIHHPGA